MLNSLGIFLQVLKALENLSSVEPVLNGTVLSGHPVLSGQFPESRKLIPLITLILASIKRSPVFPGRGHHLRNPNRTFSFVLTCIKRSHGINYFFIQLQIMQRTRFSN